MSQTTDLDVDVSKILRGLRKRAGYSLQNLAVEAGFKGASSIQRYENSEQYHKQFLPYDVVDKFASVLVGKGTPPIRDAEMMALVGPIADAAFPLASFPRSKKSEEPGETENPVIQTGTVEERDLPAFDTRQSEDVSDGFVLSDEVAEYARRPASLFGVKGAFAFYVPVDSMEPKLPEGSLQVVHPNKKIRSGDDALITVKFLGTDSPVTVLLRIDSVSKDKVVGHTYRQLEIPISFDRSDIVQMGRLLYVEDLIG